MDCDEDPDPALENQLMSSAAETVIRHTDGGRFSSATIIAAAFWLGAAYVEYSRASMKRRCVDSRSKQLRQWLGVLKPQPQSRDKIVGYRWLVRRNKPRQRQLTCTEYGAQRPIR